MSSNHQNLQSLLEKTEHYDKDERYMATSDLCNLLQKNSSNLSSPSSCNPMIDSNMERRVCTTVLALLDDPSNDVQAIAVKTLGVLLKKVKEEQVNVISLRLCSLILSDGKTELRDVYSIGLRTLIKTIPLKMGDSIAPRLTVSLLKEGLSDSSKSEDILLSCIDVLNQLVIRFGSILVREHERILNTCFNLIPTSTHKSVFQKRACTTIGTLSTHLSDVLLTRCVESLLQKIQRKHANPNERRAFIRTMCIVSHTVGHRIGKDIDRIVPIFLFSIGDGNDDDTDDIEEEEKLQNELREACFAGFESFVLYCPVEVQPFLPEIIQVTLRFMRYDPNYSYDDTDEMDIDQDQDNDNLSYADEDDEFEEEDDYFSDDDDDDDSWKVRRSTVKCLSAVIQSMKQDPSVLWKQLFLEKTVADALVDRFKEREEICRTDVIDCFTKLLSVTIDACNAGLIPPDFIDLQAYFIPAIIQACRQLLTNKKKHNVCTTSSSNNTNDSTKSSALALLSTLCQVGIGSQSQIEQVLSCIQSVLSDSTNKSLKLDALYFVRTMLSSNRHSRQDIQRTLPQLIPQLCLTVQEDWYKVIAESLRVLSELPPYFSSQKDNITDYKDIATQLYAAIQPRLAAYDLDQEIKGCALSASASLLSYMHVFLSIEERNTLLNLILDRLKKETTRLSSLKTLSTIAANDTIDISNIVLPTIQELSSLLRQQNRALKQSSLETLNVVVQNHSPPSHVHQKQEIQMIGSTIVDSDLHIAHLGLCTAISILQTCPLSKPFVKTYIIPPSLLLSTSSALQDAAALESLLSFLQHLIETQTIDFEELYQSLSSRANNLSNASSNKHSLMNLAKCLAVITTSPSTTQASQEKVLTNLLSILEKPTPIPSDCDPQTLIQIHLSLLLSGEIGRRMDFQNYSQRFLNIFVGCIMDASNKNSEEMKHAAAYAFGRASTGSVTVFLPALLGALEQNTTIQKKQYLLLLSLKEFISCHREENKISSTTNSTWVSEIMPHLILHCSDKEEGVRVMVAECLGSLTSLYPSLVLPQLQELVVTHSGQSNCEISTNEDRDVIVTEKMKKDFLICWTCANAIKFAISAAASIAKNDTSGKNFQYLSPYLPSFLALLNEQNLSVKNAALLMVYSAIHHCPSLVVEYMPKQILPSLYKIAQLNYKRVVDLGPFKHTVDDALPLRKSAMSIFSTCLENCPSSLDISAFMPILAKALSDDTEDVQLQAHQIVIYMCQNSDNAVVIVSFAEYFVDPLEKCIHKKKGNKLGTELERVNEWIKSGLRTLLALSCVEGVMNCRKLADFVERTKNNTKFHAMLEALKEEH